MMEMMETNPGYIRDDQVRMTRRFDSAFTVWFKEDMAVFAWVKRLLGVRIENYKIFEDGILMCAIANKILEGSITHEEVIYSSALQRLELSIKALHNYLGVAPVLDSCAVVEGRGQEDLLEYLLNLKYTSDRHEQEKLLLESDVYRVADNYTKRREAEKITIPPTVSSFSHRRPLSHENNHEQKLTATQKPIVNTHSSRSPNASNQVACNQDNDDSVRLTKSSNETTYTGEGEHENTPSTASKSMRSRMSARRDEPTVPKSSSNRSRDTELTSQAQPERASPYSPEESMLKRQETYVVSSPVRAKGPPKLLKKSSLTVTLNTPPSSPRHRKHTAEFGVPKTSSSSPENKDHDQMKTNKELVTNLNDLLDEASSTRIFPRSGFDRNIMYSPFSMPFISVRNKENQLISEGYQDDQDQNIDKDKNKTTRSQEELTPTMVARLASRTPKGGLSNQS